MKKDNIIIFDVDIPTFRNNKILDRAYAIQFPGATVISSLCDVAAANDWLVMTGDVFLKTKPQFKRAVCLSNQVTPEYAKLLMMGVEPGVLMSGESPNVAWSFYHKLPNLSKGFRYACLFRGTSNRIHYRTKFYPHYWPMPQKKVDNPPPFKKRQILGMVCSFKERFGYNRKNLGSLLKAPFRWGKILWYQGTDVHARFPDLYARRLSAIKTFAPKDNFRLYGHGWDVARKSISSMRDINFTHIPMSCKDKLLTLSFFRYTLVIENCVYPGYLTEKIFDAMLAGTVPVYLGAPDIKDFVPEECFVDIRKYDNLEILWQDISTWPEKKWQKYIDAINEYLESDSYSPFKEENVALKWFQWLTE